MATLTTKNKTIDQLACEVILGRDINGLSWGSGDTRKKNLGTLYNDVQSRVNALLKDTDEFIRALARLAIDGKVGNGDTRKAFLGKYYDKTQDKINYVVKVAKAILCKDNPYGSGEERKKKLGADYDLVQYYVNILVKTMSTLDVINDVSDIPKYTTLGTRTFKLLSLNNLFRQFKVWWQGGSSSAYVRGSGCALSSAIMVATAFATKNINKLMTPTDFHNKLEKTVVGRSDTKSGTPMSPKGTVTLLKYYGVNATWNPYKSNTSKKTIEEHLKKGKPVLIWLYDTSGKYTKYLHTTVLVGVTNTGKWIMLDSGGRKLDGRYGVKIVDPTDVYNHIRFCNSGKASSSNYWYNLQSSSGVVFVNP